MIDPKTEIKQSVYNDIKKGYDLLMRDIAKSLGGDKRVYAIAGGSGSGKSRIAERLACLDERIQRFSLDNGFLGPIVLPGNKKDYDHPDCYNLDVFNATINQFRRGLNEFILPTYKKLDGTKNKARYNLKGKNVIIVEGIHALNRKLLAEIDVGIFIDVTSKTRLERRIKRDEEGYGRSLATTQSNWDLVENAYINHVWPTRKYAHLIIKNEVSAKELEKLLE